MAKKQKNVAAGRQMTLVCVTHQRPWKKCACAPDTGAWIYVTKKEMTHYVETGLIPDHAAGLYHYEGVEVPPPIPLVHPPHYNLKI